MIKKALIITDVQKDFCPGGSLATRDGNKIVPIINKIVEDHDFDKIIITQDWHPKHHKSFASNYDDHEPYDSIKTEIGVDNLWPDHCVAGSEGAEFHDDLNINPAHLIIRKGTNPRLDSYSTFLENDQATPTGLVGYLSDHEIREVYLCGIATDICVYYSALDAMKFGFETYVIIDATAGVDVPEGNVKKTVKDMQAKGVHIIRTKVLRGLLNEQS